MTVIRPYTAECNDCGHVMPFKMMLLSYSPSAPPPKEIDFSSSCSECGSENTKAIDDQEGLGKLRGRSTTARKKP